MTPPSSRTRLALLVLGGVALLLRVVAAYAVEAAARRRGALCLFDDTAIYWKLAEAIRLGLPYEVDQFGIPHRALRTPGYPLFLAACQAVFGPQAAIGARLVQGLLGAACVPLVYALTRAVRPAVPASVAVVAAGLAAVEPYWAGTSALLLSEAVFVPLMLIMLWGMAATWPGRGAPLPRNGWPVAIAAGLAAGSAVLVKPSWFLAPLAGCAIACLSPRNVRGAAGVLLGMALVLAPWAIRNERAVGKPVITALWGGASLYDGLNPSADGSSDMRFLADPRFRSLGEIEQDRALRDVALAFARENPLRVARLALVKAGRFWSPWPNAAEFRASWSNLASAAVTLPLFGLLIAGAWVVRRDPRALGLLAGPLLYFLALHVVFVSSIRYRIPAQVPAFGLVAIGGMAVVRRMGRLVAAGRS